MLDDIGEVFEMDEDSGNIFASVPFGDLSFDYLLGAEGVNVVLLTDVTVNRVHDIDTAKISESEKIPLHTGDEKSGEVILLGASQRENVDLTDCVTEKVSIARTLLCQNENDKSELNVSTSGCEKDGQAGNLEPLDNLRYSARKLKANSKFQTVMRHKDHCYFRYDTADNKNIVGFVSSVEKDKNVEKISESRIEIGNSGGVANNYWRQKYYSEMRRSNVLAKQLKTVTEFAVQNDCARRMLRPCSRDTNSELMWGKLGEFQIERITWKVDLRSGTVDKPVLGDLQNVSILLRWFGWLLIPVSYLLVM